MYVIHNDCFFPSALAYAVGERHAVEAHAEWSSSHQYAAKFKPKAIILLDEDKEAIAFGKDAKNTLSVQSESCFGLIYSQ